MIFNKHLLQLNRIQFATGRVHHRKTTGLDTVGMRTKSGRTKFEICQWVYPQDNLRVDAQQNVL
jgi:hypothetical protein